MRESNPELHRQRVSASLKGRYGEESRRWKGDKAGYVAIHMWLTKHYGKGDVCQKCRTTTASRLEWANISKAYQRTRDDWLVLCPSCHRKYDERNHCRNGHIYIEDNLYVNPRGHRECRICRLEAQRRWRLKNAKGD